MHFLMEWSLTPEQETDLKAKLNTVKQELRSLGAVRRAGRRERLFQIVSASLSDKTLTPLGAHVGQGPAVPGGRAAAAARMTAEGAQLMAATLEKSRSIADVSIASTMPTPC